MLELTCILFVAFLVDLFIGDPRYRYHPIKIIGQSISFLEKVLRKVGCSGRSGGVLLVITVVAAFVTLYLAISFALHRIHFLLGICFDFYACYSCLAIGDLINHVRPVIHALESGKLTEAKESIALIVGRDVRFLDEKGVCRAAVETLAENFVDGFLSPLFWCLMGAILANLLGLSPVKTAMSFMLAFKVASTLDSMIGYRNPEYIDFGLAGARLDDMMNFVPARFSLIILFIGAGFSGFHPVRGLKVAMRDRLKHDSPNAAHAESFVAGALDIRLAGPVKYPDALKNKPWLGNGNPDPGPVHIKKTVRLV
ncbi:MAG: cobalamin biosynthesis protein CobD, partial [Deltaproteobacteria bacterium]|nr:cobalamin biosynthesis protein CobD [Deltaproteobacteria bacterium]